MKARFGADENVAREDLGKKKTCAFCGSVDKTGNMKFERHQDGPTQEIEGSTYQIACWFCKDCG